MLTNNSHKYYHNYTNPMTMAKCVDNAEALQRDDWDARIENAQHHAFKRRHAAAMDEPYTAKRAALFARLSNPHHHNWFTADLEPSVTAEAPLVIECLNDVRARAKRPLTPHMLPYLPSGILESPALAPYLQRWRLDATAAVAAASTRARCAYPTLD
jgi:hypothetical protein